jgi:putative toxin-antitoxin system antitoxin component (TIGR02293 family)
MAIKTRTNGPEEPSRDIVQFRKYLRSGKPGPHAYVALLGLRTFDSGELLRTVEKGLSFRALERFQQNLSLSMAQIIQLVQIPLRTLARRRKEGRLQSDESDRLLRASRLFGQALELFEGDTTAARTWLSSPQPALGGNIPLEIAKTDIGAREVESLIGRLEHGVFS